MKILFSFIKFILYIMSGLIIFLLLLPYFISTGEKKLEKDCKPFSDSRFLEVKGVQIHYRLFEPDQTDISGNVLFVHGFSGSVFSWRNNLEFFNDEGFRVVAVDLPAYGFSDKRTDINHSPTARAELLWEVLKLLPGEKWSIVGHSMGASVVVAMAYMLPEKTEYLILVNGAYFNMSLSERRGAFRNLLHFPPVQRWGEVIAARRFFYYEKIEELLGSAYGETPDSTAVAGYLEPFLYKGTAKAVINSFLNNFETFSVEPKQIDAPTLIIWGDQDTWVPLSAGEKIHNDLPNSELVVLENCGHCPMETHSEEFNQILLNFLKGRP
jgi:pimeloyl-ACP methyl ester carboxylesterase